MAKQVRQAGCADIGPCVHSVVPRCDGQRLLLDITRPIYEYEPSKDDENLWASEATGTAIYERGIMKKILERIEVVSSLE